MMQVDEKNAAVNIKQHTSGAFLGWSPKMYVATYHNQHWDSGQLISGDQLRISVAATALQFGQSAVEGCRAYQKPSGEKLLFRIQRHHQRLQSSCQRLCMPAPDFSQFTQAIKVIIHDEQQWRTPMFSNTLYIRPMVFGSSSHILPAPAEDYKFVVLVAPFRTAYKSKGIRLLAENQFGRTAKGGLGSSKTASNYAHLLQVAEAAQQKGYDSILWLDASTHSLIESCNVMNIFFEVEGKLLTPALSDTIIAGITRQSVIDLAKGEFGLAVEESDIAMTEIIKLHRAGVLKSIFVTATAAGIQPVSLLNVNGQLIELDKLSNTLQALRARLIGIQQGKTHDNHTWVTSVMC